MGFGFSLGGSTKKSTSSGTEDIDATKKSTSQLEVDEEGIFKLIQDSLAGPSGLASIFGAESGAGLYESTVAKGGTEDLLAKIAGELAKVTGKTTNEEVIDSMTKTTGKTRGKEGTFGATFSPSPV